MKRIIIIGANDFQRPLIQKAREMGYETHVFAWREGASGAQDADCFYEISITEKEEILKICRGLKPEGVATIGSDLANITVQYLARELGLTANSRECTENTTNKYLMRKALKKAGLPVPFFQRVRVGEEIVPPGFPVIVKPTDRSGSRAVTRAESQEELNEAVRQAAAQSFESRAIVEEYLEGAEYSVECVSWKGKHTCLAVTKKFTTGAPHYIEVGHIEPAPISEELYKEIESTVSKALTALGVEYGASHSELRVDREGNLHVIEIGSRMGGDCIGSDLVPLSTGRDYVKMVIDIACGRAPEIPEKENHVAAVRFLMDENDYRHLKYLRENYPGFIKKEAVPERLSFENIVDSGTRPGFYILQTDTYEEMDKLLHGKIHENPIELPETPIHRLSFHLSPGTGVMDNTFYIKRDDLLPFSFGGNKVRFAWEFVEDMRAKNCDSMIIYGNYHSNLCRILGALCRRLSIPCCMVHNTEDVKEDYDSLNSRLIRLKGVRELPCTKKNIGETVQRAMDMLAEEGYRPYYIYGDMRGKGNEGVPMEGYKKAYEEICAYEQENGIHFDYIFLASSTNATQSGLLMGSLIKKDGRKIVGISVSRNEKRGREVIEENLREYARKHNLSLPENFREEIIFTDTYMEDGYGAFSQNILDVIKLVYKTDEIPLDMTYTGKGFYGMISYIKEHNLAKKNILFLHTGGTPLFFDLLEQGYLDGKGPKDTP